ncbi:MAG TPA: type I restriction-modification enzyme R subunit C-terminal domain-containing protein [Acidothermaceae bacterium]|nr:type I restriction-modification enzyme R subunit C-terminal domain-containing protein [Acidothermaceae bacterium]
MSNDGDRYLTPEARARVQIDKMLAAAGWAVQGRSEIDLSASRGVAIREFPLEGGNEADYLLFVDHQAVGALEAKKEGATLIGVEPQSAKYAAGLPDTIKAPVRPLPFLYESTGVETRFTNGLDPDPRSREVFAIHRPETLAGWLDDAAKDVAAPTTRARLRRMPPIDAEALWPAQERALAGLETSLSKDRPRALIQMATGSGKTYVAANASWRLVRLAGARRVLFLVDRANLGRQAEGEFERFRVPGDGRKFTELYNVQRLTSNRIDPAARVVICTIQRLYSILRGEDDLDPELDERSAGDAINTARIDVVYNAFIPPETFDVVIVDECHRSIYGLWSQVLAYFDAHIIGLTATPSKQTLGFFNQNLVFAYTHEEAVADRVNVDFDVYRIRTEISEKGATVEKGTWLQVRDRLTRKKRWEELEDDLAYTSAEINANVVAEDQIRTVIRHFRDVVGTELFPGRPTVPKTLIFAKDDSHADDIVRIVREEFGKGNDFCVKITYRTTGVKPEELLAQFRTATMPRIAVTVDMIATGTDVKPLECLIFMRMVKSKNFFEQMKGRGVRVVSDTELQGVSPGATTKTRFVLVDACGVTEVDMGEARPLERLKTVALKALFEQIALGNRDPDVVSSIASRLNRLDCQLTKPDRAELTDLAGGVDPGRIAHDLVLAVDIDAAYDQVEAETGELPTDEQVHAARALRIEAAVEALASNPKLRARILEVRSSYEQTIDTVSTDTVIEAGFSTDATTRAKQTVTDWKAFIEANKDELTALQILYSKPAGKRLTFAEIRELANAIQRPPRAWTAEQLWDAYETVERSRVRGHGGRVLTDLVSLVRFTIEYAPELVPWTETVNERFAGWLGAQAQHGVVFDPAQRQWLELIRDQIAGSLTIAPEDLMEPPFSQHGGLARARAIFGDQLEPLLATLSAELAA